MYREDGPRIFKNMSGPEVERKKNLVRIWSITVKTNLKVGVYHWTFINHIRNRATNFYTLIKILTIPQGL